MVTATTKPSGTASTPAKSAAEIPGEKAAKPGVKAVRVNPPEVTVRRKELVTRIAEKSGMKPNVIKSVLDAVLREMGDSLSAGEALNLPPFGKVTVNRRKDLENAEILLCKIRRNHGPAIAPEFSDGED